MTTHEPGGRRSAQGYLLLFLLLAAGILATGHFYHRHFTRHVRAHAEEELTAIGELKVNELVQFRRERLADAIVLSRSASFAGLVRRALGSPPDLKAQGQLQEWLGEYVAPFQYDRAFLLDAQGVERLAVPTAPGRQAAALAVSVAETLRSGQFVFQDFYRDDWNQRIYLALLVPIHDETQAGRVLGVVGLRIDPTESLYPMVNRSPVPSATGEIVLLRREGDAAINLNDLRSRPGMALTERVPLSEPRRTAVMAVQGRQGMVEGRDGLGNPVMGYVGAVPDSPWFIALRLETAEVLAPAKEQMWLTIALMAALLAGLGAGLGLIWRHQRVRYYREKAATAETLRASEERFRDIAENAGVWIWETDAEGRYTYVSQMVEKILGYRPEEVLQRYFYDFFHPDDRESLKAAALAGFAAKQAFREFVNRNVHKNGQTVWLSTSGSPVLDDQGNLLGFRGADADITGTKQAEAALRASEEHYRTVIENLGEGIGLVSPNEQFTFANRAAEEIFGVPPGGLLGRSLREFTPPEQFDRIRAQTDQRQVGEKSAYEIEISRPDGEKRSLLVTAVPQFGRLGEFVGTFGVFRDITERRRAVEALRESETKFRVLSEDSITGVVIIREGRLDYVNPAAARMIGWSPAELLAAPAVLGFVVEEDRPLLGANILRRLAGERDEVVSSFRIRKKDGSLAHLESLGCRINLEGRVCVMATIMDVTERKQAEVERERLIGELRQTLAEVKTLGGLLPICAGCKKIRDDTGYWNQVEVYIQRHTDAKFSHGMCPECLKKYYPDLNIT